MTKWERIEIRPLFQKLSNDAAEWEPPKVLPRTKRLGKIILPQLEEYEAGKYRTDRNECKGFFESIEKFVSTGLPISLEHFENLVNQYRNRITPYPHYSGIKLTVPTDFSELDQVQPDDLPTNLEDEEDDDQGASLKLM